MELVIGAALVAHRREEVSGDCYGIQIDGTFTVGFRRHCILSISNTQLHGWRYWDTILSQRLVNLRCHETTNA
jgi:hypothetical protein